MSNPSFPTGVMYAIDNSNRSCTNINVLSVNCQNIDPFSHGPAETSCVINACVSANSQFGLGAPGDIDPGCDANFPSSAQYEYDPKSTEITYDKTCPSVYSLQ